MKTLSETDFEQLQNSNRSVELIQRQYEFLIHGTSTQRNIEAATLGNGIQKLSSHTQREALDYFYNHREERSWMKFVPASGAASRMLAPFFAFQKARTSPDFDFESYCDSDEGIPIAKLFKQLKKLPFYALAYAKIIQNDSLPINGELEFFEAFVSTVLLEEGLGYPNLPKALIPFFNDELGQQWTAFEAQLQEGLQLGDQYKAIPIHLTIDKENRAAFEEVESKFKSNLDSELLKSFSVEYSYQHPLTDTPYLNDQNEWVRDEKGKIAFRKGGHGALLENLNHLEADCIWIKNIDNILLNDANAIGEQWMQILAGYLLKIQNQLFSHLRALEDQKSDINLDEIVTFIKLHFDPEYKLDNSDKLPNEILFDYLYRPIRICGMIPNEGAKGGGPFWKKDAQGRRLQIIEGVELDMKQEEHKSAVSQSSHFNPVMMVCGITNHKGEKFSLYDFRDDKRFMVSEKTQGSSTVKILEWPGLWNGGMAAWNSLFIEVPSETFHPVKTIADLIL